MAVLGLRFCARAFSNCGKWGPLFIVVLGPLLRPLLLRSTGSRRAGSVIVAHGPSCSTARGIFPDQGSNPCPLHWQADSQPLHHQGSPTLVFLIIAFLVGMKRYLTVFLFCISLMASDVEHFSTSAYWLDAFSSVWEKFSAIISLNITLSHFILRFQLHVV